MDSFRGSIPPNFISFRLENQTTEVANAPAYPSAIASTVSPPTEMGLQAQDPSTPQQASRSQADDVTSTHSVDSDPDVTTYAECMVRQIESAQTLSQSQQGSTQIDRSGYRPKCPGGSFCTAYHREQEGKHPYNNR